jgi:hypothetical protein
MGVDVMKQHGMLFADRLMPAMIDGSKTQTRRPVKLSHVLTPEQKRIGFEVCDDPSKFRRSLLVKGVPRLTIPTRHPDDGDVPWEDCGGECLYCPLGEVGDLIWCRETWASIGDEGEGVPLAYVYRADGGDYSDWESVDGDKFRWKPSIHTPRAACRCWKEITDVRVQRIQEITDNDAFAEGIRHARDFPEMGLLPKEPLSDGTPCSDVVAPRYAFSKSWDSIYAGSWDRNDWVWALTFKPTEAPQ